MIRNSTNCLKWPRSTSAIANGVILMVLCALASAGFVRADEFTSPDFRVLDPVLFSSGYSTASGYQLWGSVSQIGIGTSTATNFEVRSGFLYFPEPAAAPVPTPTPTPTPTPAYPFGGGRLYESLLQLLGLTPHPRSLARCPLAADLDCDGTVDLRDVSVFLYLAPRSLPNPADLNSDQRVDLRDLSVLLTSWTGSLVPFASEESQKLAYGRESRAKISRTQFASAEQGQERQSGGISSAKEIGQKLQKSQFAKTIMRVFASYFRLMSDIMARAISRIGSSLKSL